MGNEVNTLPIYELTMDDGAVGVYSIAVVKRPAMESRWQAFSKQGEPAKFSVENEEKRMVLAVLCRADFPIYRRDADGFEYYVYFSKPTIEKLVQRMLANGFENTFNNEHREGTVIEGMQMTQCFIKDSSKGINPKGFEDVEEGSCFCQWHVTSDEVWRSIRENVWTGVSLEGYFSAREPVAETVEDVLRQGE